MVVARALSQRFQVRRLDARARRKAGRRVKGALLQENRLYVLVRHGSLLTNDCGCETQHSRIASGWPASAAPASVPRLREQPLDHGARLPGITAAEQVGVVQHMVEVVELGTRLPGRLE